MDLPHLDTICVLATNSKYSRLTETNQLIQNELVSKEELEKVLNQYENDIVSTNSSVAGIAENLADNYMYRKNTSLINKQLDAYLSVTREDIQRVAKKYYTKNARVVLFYLPKSSN